MNERNKNQQKSTKINYLINKNDYKNIIIKNDGIEFDYFGEKLKFKNVFINTLGKYQIENCALGIKVLEFVSKRDNWKIDESKLRFSFKELNIEGRMSIKYMDDDNGKKKMIILDGAHNPQKMSALIKSIKSLNLKQKIAFVIAFKNDKNFKKMLDYIIPISNKIFLTSFYVDDMDFIQVSTEPEYVAKNLEIKGCKKYEIVKNSNEALKSALNSHEVVVVTGSLYLLHKLYISIIK